MLTALTLTDAAWSRIPMPVRTVARPVTIGPLPALEMYRSLLGRPFMKVYAYRVGDTLVDTGLAAAAPTVVDWARAGGARRAILTHHHEDHAGSAAALASVGIDVRSTETTARLLETPLPLPFYEHLVWSKPPPARPAPLPTELEVDGIRAEVIPAPGHCVDQVCIWLPDRGWLFCGDVFLHERVRLFRRDEDFAATVDSLRRLVALPVESLFCAHRPRIERGAAALAEKLAHLLELEAKVRELHARGTPVRRIVNALGLPRGSAFERLTFGDASPENLVRSILFGPEPRPDVAARLASLPTSRP